MKRTLALALALTFFGMSLQAAVVQLSDADLATSADYVVLGTVTSVKSEWTANRSYIITLVTVKVDKYVKGEGANEVTVKIPGGVVGGMGQKTSDTPTFTLGEEVVVFLCKAGDTTQMVGMWQGKYNVVQSGGQKSVVRDSGGAVAKPGAGVGQAPAVAAVPLTKFLEDIQKHIKK